MAESDVSEQLIVNLSDPENVNKSENANIIISEEEINLWREQKNQLIMWLEDGENLDIYQAQWLLLLPWHVDPHHGIFRDYAYTLFSPNI